MPATLTPNILVGKAVAVSVGGVLAYCVSGNTDRTAAAINVTSARSGGYSQFKAGILGGTGSITCVYNGDDVPTGFVNGAEATLILDTVGYETGYANVVSGTPTTPHGRLITAQVLLTSIKDSWSAEGEYNFSVDFTFTGPYAVVETATGGTTTT